MSDLKTELAALKARLEELERKAKPQAPTNFNAGPVGPTTTELALSRLSMSPEVIAEFASAIPRDMAQEMINERRAPQNLAPLTAGTAGSATPRLEPNRTGWRDPGPLEVPGGQRTQDLIGGLCDVQDARDRAELIAKEAQRLAPAKK
jgi:hypothetical protein